MILIPKAGVAADVYGVDIAGDQIEAAKKREKRIGFEVLIETAVGMANVRGHRAIEPAVRGHVLRLSPIMPPRHRAAPR